MPASMKILGWKAQGLRCPDHEVDFTHSHNESPYRVSLIQMPNGTGKTTTLSLLRAALSGAAKDWNPSHINEFRKKGSMNRPGRFEVRLLLNQKRATIIMNFDFENSHVSYRTTYGPGMHSDFNPPHEFKRFLNSAFVNFFVFDGELASHLLDSTQTHAEAVVENLFQINTLETLKKRVREYWEYQTQSVTATEERGLTRRQNRLRELKDRLNSLKSEKKRLERKRREIASRLQQQQALYDQEIKKEEEQSTKLTKAELEVNGRKAVVREVALDVLDRMRDPHAVSATFASALSNLKNGLDRVKLPESAAREFFEELANEAECICGTHITSEIRDRIRSRAAQYLGSEDVALLNSMKTVIHDAVGASLDESERALNARMDELVGAISLERDATFELDELHRIAEEADPAVMRAREEIIGLQGQLMEIERDLEKFDSSDDLGDDKSTGIQVMEKKITKAEADLAEITQTMQTKAKRDILIGILDEAHMRARESIMDEICSQANARISELMPHNNIFISGIERCLKLNDQEGGSVGETLSVAYSFLATLFNRSEHKLPFIVDSPAGPIDLGIRPKIGELIPKLTDQFIAFTISSERSRFVPSLKVASKGDIQFITLFRKIAPEYVSEARTVANYVETDDGIRVQDENFFNEFQLESEEA